MASNVLGLLELSENVFGKDFTKFDTHLIYGTGAITSDPQREGQEESIPKELIPQTTPCTKILCSYMAMRAPSSKQDV